MSIVEIIKSEINFFLKENDDYRGEHTAPTSDDSPMYDLTDTYSDDIYGYDAARMYPHYHDNRDYEALSIIGSARNKPNKAIKIYRAVPDNNFEIKNKLKPLFDIVNYYNKWNFLPIKNNITYGLQDKYENTTYDEKITLILKDIYSQIDSLKNMMNGEKKTINNGDWVTISLNYAKEHGKSNLNNKYKIISKTVPAKHLFTDGNDIFEWGYNIA